MKKLNKLKKQIIALLAVTMLAGCGIPEPEEPVVRVKCIQVHDQLNTWADSRYAIYERLDTHERICSSVVLALEGEEFSVHWSQLRLY